MMSEEQDFHPHFYIETACFMLALVERLLPILFGVARRIQTSGRQMAERVGFEPTIGF